MLTPRHRQTGVTLIEILIGIVVLSIMFSIALPAFQAYIQNSKVRNAADAMANGLQLARSQAIARNLLVQYQLQNNNTGWAVTEVATAAAVQTWSSAEGAQQTQITPTPANATTITFNALGRVVANADASPTLTALDVASLIVVDGVRPMRVAIGNAGSARICDPSVAAASDPRAC